MKLILFAKHLAGFNISELVKEAIISKVDGYDLPVRPGYAVNPDNVSTALPELVKTMADEGLCIPMCTGNWDMVDPGSPDVEKILSAMNESNIRLFKMGYFMFNPLEQDYNSEVDRIRNIFEEWEKLASKYNVTICYHTHSGPYMGCTAAGLRELIKGFDPNCIGAYPDAGHLSAAGEEFPMVCSILGEYMKIVGIKEVVKAWKDDGSRSIQYKHLPMGEGVLETETIFNHLRKIDFDGPVSIHVEYEGSQQELIEGGRRDAIILRRIMDSI